MTVLEQALQALAPRLPITVAYSGGADSTALLWACVQRWPQHTLAVHVHHGLQVAADAFERHCERQCQAWGVPLVVRHVDARHARRQSPEEAARQMRYEQLMHAARAHWGSENTGTIVLGQHADDQVETVLLALSRGAGLPGLAAMPQRWQREGIAFERPFLRVPGAELRAWLQDQRIEWIEDPTNTDTRYTRNRIRAHLLPALQHTFTHFQAAFARSASHAAQAQELLEELAVQDLAVIGMPPHIQKLQSLSAARQGNALRHWLFTQHHCTPSAAQLQELLRVIQTCRTRAHHIRIKTGTGYTLRSGETLTWVPQD